MRKNSKDEIVKAAISLFNTKGYHGTSIRDIAKIANINVANISYYFQSKEGLLEYCFTEYFEKYLKELEGGLTELETGALPCLKKIIKNIVAFHSENIHLTRFIVRELTLDTQMVREMMSIYSVKERYYFTKVLEKGMVKEEFSKININYFILQLKSQLTMPFLNSQYIAEVLHIFTHEKYFAERYTKEVYRWLESVLISPQPRLNKPFIVNL